MVCRHLPPPTSESSYPLGGIVCFFIICALLLVLVFSEFDDKWVGGLALHLMMPIPCGHHSLVFEEDHASAVTYRGDTAWITPFVEVGRVVRVGPRLSFLLMGFSLVWCFWVLWEQTRINYILSAFFYLWITSISTLDQRVLMIYNVWLFKNNKL